MRGNSHSADRGQAYTLEGFVSAMIVLMALLFALQAVVITPTTGGLSDRTVQSQLEQETQDALVVGATADGSDGYQDLSTLVRYWNVSEGAGHYYNTSDPEVDDFHYTPANDTEFTDEFALGRVLADRFTDRGLSYNVDLVYWDNTTETYEHEALVEQGDSEAVTASYTVTLYESDNLTAPDDQSRNTSLRDAYYCEAPDDTGPGEYEEEHHGEDCYPIPPATPAPEEDDGSEIYNVVEVRVTVW